MRSDAKFRTWTSIAALGLGVAAGALVAPRVAWAFDVEDVDGQTLTVDVTNTAIGDYLFDNRNDSKVGVPAPGTILDDTYGEFIDHLNIQLFYGRLRAGVRVDANLYAGQLDDFDLQEIGKTYLPEATGAERYVYENSFRSELNTRFRNTVYPAKLYVGYTAPSVDLTLGDFYAQLGRGLVLSVRKIDEVGQDTTIRGFKGSFKKSFEDGSVSVTTLAGLGNPLRVDDRSGRRLSGTGNPIFFGFPVASDYRFYAFDSSGYAGYQTVRARPSYLEDSIFGVSIEGGPKPFLIGAHASLVRRLSNAESFARCSAAGSRSCASDFPTFSTANQSRLHDTILSASGSLNLPNLWDHGDAYVEAMVQHNADGRWLGLDSGAPRVTPDLTGYGIYASASLAEGPVTVTLEGKHYRSVLPLAGNINSDASSDPAFHGNEFDTVAYNQPPIADSDYQEPHGALNVCITGGRSRVDYLIAQGMSAFAWVGYFDSQTEASAQNVECETDDATIVTHTWDGAAGVDYSLEKGKSFLKAWVGARNTARGEAVVDVATDEDTDTFYREGYVRYNVAKHLAGDFTLEAQGFHRHRYEPSLAREAWNEGENYLALKWAPRFAFIFGFEYLGRAGCDADPETGVCFYFSGGAQYKSTEKEHFFDMLFDTINVFVGQRRGAIRCVSGVCRQFPPFEGAKVELTSRF